MKSLLVTIVLLLSLGGAVAYALHVWLSLSGVELGFHGTLALILCVVFVTGLGVGLMRLSYHSHRRGYDERAAGIKPPQRDQD